MLSAQSSSASASHGWPHLLFTGFGIQESCGREEEENVTELRFDEKSLYETAEAAEEASPAAVEALEAAVKSAEPQRRLSRKRVSFPDDETKLVSHFIDPESDLAKSFPGPTNQSLISAYKLSCEKHNTQPLDKIIEQLSALDLGKERSASLSLRGLDLDSHQCESLEEVLRHVPLQLFDLGTANTNSDGLIALFDMVEFYEAATHISIASASLDVRSWQACSRMIKKTECLEWLDAAQVPLSEQSSSILGRALRANAMLRVLHLDSCCLAGRPFILLANALKLNKNLKELYLADNNLGYQDAVHLSMLLRSNSCLEYLDIKNNNIRDKGMDVICSAFVGTDGNSSLNSLVVWNNELTSECAPAIGRALAANTSLETLNLGLNKLGDDGLMAIVNSGLANNRSLVNLGLQDNAIGCTGVMVLAEALVKGSALQRIDLRKNPVLLSGLNVLREALDNCPQLCCIDLTSTVAGDDNTEEVMGIIGEMAGICSSRLKQMEQQTNAEEDDDKIDELRKIAKPANLRNPRKISLTCPTPIREATPPVQVTVNGTPNPDWNKADETRKKKRERKLRSPLPSPLPSPQQSPSVGGSSRFKVSLVTDTPPVISPSPRNRFTVTPVMEESADPASVIRSSPAKVIVGFDVNEEHSI